MTIIDVHGRPEPPVAGGELDTLLGFLDYQHATFAWKCGGLDAAGLSATVGVSTMTLGGMLKHLAHVEEGWFCEDFLGRAPSPPWDAVDFESDPEWDWRTAAEDTPAELFALWHRAVDRARPPRSQKLSLTAARSIRCGLRLSGAILHGLAARAGTSGPQRLA